MSTIIEAVAAVNPARLTSCPRCEGRGTVTFTRPGGWLKERCSVCRGACRVDPETAETVRTLQRHADAALGVVDGPCCLSEEGGDPCVSCVPPDLFPDEPFVPYEPSEADEADYKAWSREREVRLWEERIAADEAARARTFVERLYGIANDFCDQQDATVAWLGEKIARIADQARFLEATGPDSYEDRLAAMMDAAVLDAEARMATHAGR